MSKVFQPPVYSTKQLFLYQNIETMKIKMSVMLMSIAMVLMTVLVNAQPAPQAMGTPAEHAQKQTEQLSAALELSKKQTEKVGAINLKYATEMRTMREEMRAKWEAGEEVNREEMREKMKALVNARTEEIKGVLTPTQIEKFDVILEQGKTEGQARRKKANKEQQRNN